MTGLAGAKGEYTEQRAKSSHGWGRYEGISWEKPCAGIAANRRIAARSCSARCSLDRTSAILAKRAPSWVWSFRPNRGSQNASGFCAGRGPPFTRVRPTTICAGPICKYYLIGNNIYERGAPICNAQTTIQCHTERQPYVAWMRSPFPDFVHARTFVFVFFVRLNIRCLS
jgi:hypothetical protein